MNESIWNGFKRIDFLFEGREAILVFPKEPNKNKIPVIMVYGDSDTVVPYDENGEILEKYYRENGGRIVVIGKENCGHHPHGLKDNTPIIEFIEKENSQ